MGRKSRDNIKQDLYLLLTQSQRLRASTIQKRLSEAGKTSMYKYLKVLLEEGAVIKKGRFPKIYYEAVYDMDNWNNNGSLDLLDSNVRHIWLGSE